MLNKFYLNNIQKLQENISKFGEKIIILEKIIDIVNSKNDINKYKVYIEQVNFKIKYFKDIVKINKEYLNFINNYISDNKNSSLNKKALIIGINYNTNPSFKLDGCVEDAYRIKDFLINNYNFNEEDIIFMTDDSKNINPNKENILYYLNKFTSESNPKDKLFFYFSGHGEKFIDLDNDEKDNYDEKLVTSDIKFISDDSIFKIFKRLNKDAKLFCLMDLCFSASIGDLQYTYYSLENPLNNDNKLDKNIHMISGSKDNQYSFNALIKDEYRGLLTMAFLEYIKEENILKKLISKIRKYMEVNNIPQFPVISSSKLINENDKFIFDNED